MEKASEVTSSPQIIPVRTRMRVDFPAPLAPTRITLDLGGMMQWRLRRSVDLVGV